LLEIDKSTIICMIFGLNKKTKLNYKLTYNNTCSTGKYTPSFEVSATKSWTDVKHTSEGAKWLGEFTRQKHIWAL
jgi:hypothetical protein